MKKIIIFTCITLLCVGLNSCAVHNFDECYSPVGYHHTHFGYHHVSTSRHHHYYHKPHHHYYHKPRVKTKYYYSRKYNKNTRKPKAPNNHKINKNTHMR